MLHRPIIASAFKSLKSNSKCLTSTSSSKLFKTTKPSFPFTPCSSLSSPLHHNVRALSSTSESIFSRIKGLASSNEATQSASLPSTPPTDEYQKQIYNMAKSETWTLNDFAIQIKASSGGWKTKLPFLSDTDQVKQMKRLVDLIEATMEVIGNDAGANDLKELVKKDKLKICIKCGGEMEEVNTIVQQFQSMDILHRVLRYRVENNLALPADEESAQRLLQKDLKKVLSNEELKAMQRIRTKAMKNRMQ